MCLIVFKNRMCSDTSVCKVGRPSHNNKNGEIVLQEVTQEEEGSRIHDYLSRSVLVSIGWSDGEKDHSSPSTVDLIDKVECDVEFGDCLEYEEIIVDMAMVDSDSDFEMYESLKNDKACGGDCDDVLIDEVTSRAYEHKAADVVTTDDDKNIEAKSKSHNTHGRDLQTHQDELDDDIECELADSDSDIFWKYYTIDECYQPSAVCCNVPIHSGITIHVSEWCDEMLADETYQDKIDTQFSRSEFSKPTNTTALSSLCPTDLLWVVYRCHGSHNDKHTTKSTQYKQSQNTSSGGCGTAPTRGGGREKGGRGSMGFSSGSAGGGDQDDDGNGHRRPKGHGDDDPTFSERDEESTKKVKNESKRKGNQHPRRPPEEEHDDSDSSGDDGGPRRPQKRVRRSHNDEEVRLKPSHLNVSTDTGVGTSVSYATTSTLQQQQETEPKNGSDVCDIQNRKHLAEYQLSATPTARYESWNGHNGQSAFVLTITSGIVTQNKNTSHTPQVCDSKDADLPTEAVDGYAKPTELAVVLESPPWLANYDDNDKDKGDSFPDTHTSSTPTDITDLPHGGAGCSTLVTINKEKPLPNTQATHINSIAEVELHIISGRQNTAGPLDCHPFQGLVEPPFQNDLELSMPVPFSIQCEGQEPFDEDAVVWPDLPTLVCQDPPAHGELVTGMTSSDSGDDLEDGSDNDHVPPPPQSSASLSPPFAAIPAVSFVEMYGPRLELAEIEPVVPYPPPIQED